MKIGVLGGTFNPVHKGHLSIASQLLNLKYLDKVLLVVSNCPPHKDAPDVTAKERFEMVKIATRNEKNIEPCDIEMKREGNSYSYETMRELHKLYPDDELFFVTGADMFIDIPFWYEHEKFLKTEKILIADRSNAFSDEKYMEKRKEIEEKYNPDVFFVDIETPDIASCNIRENPEKYKDFLDAEVLEYIEKNNLYKRKKQTLEHEILIALSKKIGEKRLKHTFGVAKCAKELALRFGCDGEKAYIAGLLHDIEKEDSLQNMLRFCKDLGLDDDLKESKALLHGPAGAEYAKKNFNVDDEIYSACFYHTTGKEDMSDFEKIIFLADYIEETRTQPGVDEIRKIAETNLDRAVLATMENTISYLSENGMKIYKKTIDAKNYLLKYMEKCDTIK